MGKRNRKGKLAVGDVEGSMPRSVRRDTLELVGVLLESESDSETATLLFCSTASCRFCARTLKPLLICY